MHSQMPPTMPTDPKVLRGCRFYRKENIAYSSFYTYILYIPTYTPTRFITAGTSLNVCIAQTFIDFVWKKTETLVSVVAYCKLLFCVQGALEILKLFLTHFIIIVFKYDIMYLVHLKYLYRLFANSKDKMRRCQEWDIWFLGTSRSSRYKLEISNCPSTSSEIPSIDIPSSSGYYVVHRYCNSIAIGSEGTRDRFCSSLVLDYTTHGPPVYIAYSIAMITYTRTQASCRYRETECHTFIKALIERSYTTKGQGTVIESNYERALGIVELRKKKEDAAKN